MEPQRVPVFVRLPREQALALDQMADATGRRKQELVSELISERLPLGHVSFVPNSSNGGDEVLTLHEAALLLKVSESAVLDALTRAEIPGRQLGGEWRFSRSALLEWLSGTSQNSP